MINENLPSSNLASGTICSKPPTELVSPRKNIDALPSYTPSSYVMRILIGFTRGNISAPLAKYAK